MKKFILYLLKTGKRVRIPINKKTYLHPITGKRLKTSALLNQQKQYIKDRRNTQKFIRSDKENKFGLKNVLVGQKFGEEYLESYGKFRTPETRLKEQLFVKFEQEEFIKLQTELNTRLEINSWNSNVYKSAIEHNGKWIRVEEEIMRDLELINQPGGRRYFNRKVNRVMNDLNK